MMFQPVHLCTKQKLSFFCQHVMIPDGSNNGSWFKYSTHYCNYTLVVAQVTPLELHNYMYISMHFYSFWKYATRIQIRSDCIRFTYVLCACGKCRNAAVTQKSFLCFSRTTFYCQWVNTKVVGIIIVSDRIIIVIDIIVSIGWNTVCIHAQFIAHNLEYLYN